MYENINFLMEEFVMKKKFKMICVIAVLSNVLTMTALATTPTPTEETVAAVVTETGIAPRAQLAYGWGLYPNGISADAHSRSFLLGSPETPITIDSLSVKIVSTRTDGTTKSQSNTSKSASYCEVTLVEPTGTSISNYTSTHTFKSHMGTTVETVTKGPNG